MRIVYLDCVGGVSGDMLLGAFIAGGVDPDCLRTELQKLNVSGWELVTRTVDKAGVSAVKADVIIEGPAAERTFPEIRGIILKSDLSDNVKQTAVRVFETLATAEAAVHGATLSTVHFHEVGAVDALIDICGTACCLAELGIEKLYFSPLSVSRPTPATLEILKRQTFRLTDTGIENVTPTGAAVLTTLAEDMPAPEMTLTTIGCGAGEAETVNPNVLRVLLGEEMAVAAGEDNLTLLETNVDNITPEQLAYSLEALFIAGALDVWFTPIVMKKGRPAFTVSCLSLPNLSGTLAEIIFRETGTLGIRVTAVSRQVLERETVIAQTEYGDIRVKIGKLGGASVSVRPEYSDCAAAAQASGRPLREVYDAALKGLPKS